MICSGHFCLLFLLHTGHRLSHFLCLAARRIEIIHIQLSRLCLRWRLQFRCLGRPASFAVSQGEPGQGMLHDLWKPFTRTVETIKVYILQGRWVSLYCMHSIWSTIPPFSRRYASVLGSSGGGIEMQCPHFCNFASLPSHPTHGADYRGLWQIRKRILGAFTLSSFPWARDNVHGICWLFLFVCFVFR